MELRGYRVDLMIKLKPGAADTVVLETAEILGAVLVTKNSKHFKKLSPRDDSKKGRRYRHAGTIFMGCHEDIALVRFKEALDMLCAELERTKDFADPRLLAEIRKDAVRIMR